ncbi:helix-turn-helix domain-containing protein [Streptomyces sp. NPDC102406]|uniref:helix-turn-helix domain-containing protein n=1 Tax=Streptomyces sp. NPDC102406 TaxID=3366171 RepID=UPI00382FBFA1
MTAPRATRKRTFEIRENLPAPNSAEGALFHYTPDEAAQWTPFRGRTLRNMATKHEIEHSRNGRVIYFTGEQIVALAQRHVVKPFQKPAVARAA